MTSALQVLSGRKLIVYYDYDATDSPPATKTIYEPITVKADYTPEKTVETDRLREEIVQFKATCDSQSALKYLNAIEELIDKKEALETRNKQLTGLIMKHAEALYADMASQLLAQIRKSPALEKELNEVLSQQEHIGLKDLVSKLTESIEDNWVAVGNSEGDTHRMMNIDVSELKQLNEQISLLTTLGNETGRQQTVLLKSKEFKEQIHPKKTGWGKKLLTGALYSGWVTGQVASFALRMCLGLTPSIIALLPAIFPAVWLQLLQLLMNVLAKKLPNGF